jgi:hypothetical protein
LQAVQLEVMPISSNWYELSVHYLLFLTDICGQAKGLDHHLKMEVLTDLIIGRTREELDLLRAYIHATQFDDLDQIVIDAMQSTRPFVHQLVTQALRVSHHNGCYDLVRDYEVLEQNIGAGADDSYCNAMYVGT